MKTYKDLSPKERQRINNLITEGYTQGELLEFEGRWALQDNGVTVTFF